jgi:predicted nuclease of predicted toxin-antitoxin system
VRVLLDECVPKRLRSELSGHSVTTVTESGWAGTKNGALLKLAANDFDCFVTVDRNLQFQQSTSALPIAVVLIRAPSNSIEALRPLMAEVRAVLEVIKRGEFKVVGV